MPEYDAFGRAVGEDPLAELGWVTSERPAAEPAVAEPTPAAAASSTASAPPPESHHAPVPPVLLRPGHTVLRLGRLVRLALTLAILAGVVLGGLGAIDAGREVVGDVRETFDGRTPGGSGGGAAAAGDGGSLLGRAELARALSTLERDVPGRIFSFRLDADSVDVQLRLGGGRLRVVHLQSGDERARVLVTTSAGIPASGLFRYEDLSPRAVQRAVRVTRRRLGSGVDYLIFDQSLGRPGWRAYTGDGRYVQTDRAGRFVGKHPS